MLIFSIDKIIKSLSYSICLIIVSFLVLNSAFGGTKGFCADQWPNDYKMRDYCIKQQKTAKQNLFNIAKKHGLFPDCSLPSFKFSTPKKSTHRIPQNFGMIGYKKNRGGQNRWSNYSTIP